ncbi:type I glyceraldehyde-3-phosphate dehydrogenase [Lentibacillus halophilus]|uniref:Glyceraldehyde-3-phosphate dehydrogenase n=1 Tax=Lentibacillus halophilus TaxID=295065 RepID=A0ABP3JC97_9BACI
MALKIGINGFGRIGRNVFRQAFKNDEVDVVAVNDLTDANMLAHLLQYDTVHGMLDEDVMVKGENIVVGGKEVKVLSERDPANLGWGDLGVDIVIESTGRFTQREDAKKHLDAGAKKVILSAPGKQEDLTMVMGVNENDYDPSEHYIVSNASCTTNCLAPLVKVLHDHFGVQRGLMTTVHSYTNDQQILDLPHKDYRRARAAAQNSIPTTTGAAKAVEKVLPDLKGKLNGMAVRVPTPDGSLTDFVADLDQNVSREDINKAFEAASKGEMEGIVGYTEAPLVSSDIIGNTHSSLFDAQSTMVLEDNMIKVVSWYDNEMAYSARCVDMAVYIGKQEL